jgi:hypothetical protein
MKKHQSRTALVVFLAAVALLCVTPLGAQDRQGTKAKLATPADMSRQWMQKKLECSQGIIAGLTQADFDKIRSNATSLGFLGFLEKWAGGADKPEYKQQLSFYHFAVVELMRQAREKNLDGATLAYNQLTVSCVQCHKIVRDVKK